MPAIATPVPEPLPQDQQDKILLAPDPWSRARAYQIVRSDWGHAEAFRTNAHDWRYRNADELYLGWCGQRYWEGTRVPRSSLGSYVVFQQVEAMLPRVVPGATSFDNLHFVNGNGAGDEGTDSGVMAHRALTIRRLKESRYRYHVRRAVKSMGTYGNGVIEWGWEDAEDDFVSFEQVQQNAGQQLVHHPTLGPVLVPKASMPKIKRRETKETHGRPYCRYVSIKDFYVDPNCESGDVTEAAYVIKRVYMRASQIKALRRHKGFDIPDDAYLSQLSHSKSTANQDVTKEAAELFRYNMWNPALDYSSDPSNKRIAVIEYTTPTRKIWWLQGGQDEASIIYNQPNKYGRINYLSCTYADVTDRWHALGIGDVAEGEQRLQQAVNNARIDELALALHRPMLKKRGVTIPAYQLKVAPGRVTEVEDPAGDIKQAEVTNITQQAYIEVNASDARVQRTTGMSDIAGMGMPSAGGNSANRTAMGVNTQATATDSRTTFLLATIEETLTQPLVNAFLEMERKFGDPDRAAVWLKLDERFKDLDPVKVMNMRVQCESRGAIRQTARMGFLQVFPLLAQTFLNPSLLEHLAQTQRKTINAAEMMRMLMDAINYSPRNPLLVDMTPDQIKQMASPPPEFQAKAMLQESKNASDADINNRRLFAKHLDTVIKAAFAHHGALSQMDNANEQQILAALLQAAQSQAQPPDQGGSDGAGAQV